MLSFFFFCMEVVKKSTSCHERKLSMRGVKVQMLWAQFEFHAIPLDPITNLKNYCNTCICLSTCNVSLQYMYHSLSGHYLPVHGSFHIGSHNIKYIGQRYKLNRLLSDFFGCKYYLVWENVFNCDYHNTKYCQSSI